MGSTRGTGRCDYLFGIRRGALCYGCGDCTTHCPRGVRPGDVMAAVRQEAIHHYAFPGFLARWVAQPKFLPLLLALPALLLGLVFLGKEEVEAALGMSTAPSSTIVYSFARMVPQWLLMGFFGFFSTLAVGAVAVSVVRFWRAMKAADAHNGTAAPVKGRSNSINTQSIGPSSSSGSFTKGSAPWRGTSTSV